jgi:hypothetical protein
VGDAVKSLVECHSGFEYADHPLAFTWQAARQEVKEVINQWRTPDGIWFKVRTQAGQVFDLNYIELKDEWRVITAYSREANNIHG